MIRVFIALLCACVFSTAIAEDHVTVFVNVNVIPMSVDVVLKQQTVVIENDTIVQMGHVDSVPVPKGAVVVDGTDRFLMPGLAEMHAHVTSTEIRHFDRLASLFVANGVTTIRGMLGRPEHLALRDQLASGAVFGPRLITSGPSVNGQSIGDFGGIFDMMLAADLDADKIPAIAAATAAAGTWNVPAEVLVEQMIDTTTIAELRRRPEMRFIARRVIDDWAALKEERLADPGFDTETAARTIELRRRIIFELHKAGAGLLLGSDAPQVFNVPGYSLHRELEVLVKAGLTPYEALRTGTVAVAEFLDANTGIVAKGRAADLILLNANPLTDISNSDRIHGVMLRGQWLPASELEARLKTYKVASDGESRNNP